MRHRREAVIERFAFVQPCYRHALQHFEVFTNVWCERYVVRKRCEIVTSVHVRNLDHRWVLMGLGAEELAAHLSEFRVESICDASSIADERDLSGAFRMNETT